MSQLAGRGRPIDDGVLAPWMGAGWHPDGGLHLPNTVLSVVFLINFSISIAHFSHLEFRAD
jgi:hypothetical protein